MLVDIYGVPFIDNCHLEHFVPIYVRGLIGSEGVVDVDATLV